MALLFIDSADHYATADLNMKYSTVGGGSGTTTVVAGAARTGAQGIRCACTANTSAPYLTITPTVGSVSGVLGFAINMSAGSWAAVSTNMALAQVLDAGDCQLVLQPNSDGTLSVKNASSPSSGTVLVTTSAALPTGSWTYVEWKWTIDNAAGSTEVRFDGTTVATVSGVDTRQTANTSWGTVKIGPCSTPIGNTGTWDFDDLYLLDTSGSVNTNFLGDIRVDCHWPNAVGATSGWTRSTGSDQWATVDDATINSDTDYNSVTAVPTTDTLNFPVLTNTGATILAVQVCVAAKKTAAGGGSVASVVRHSSTDYAATGQGCSTSYGVQRFVLETNPGTAAAWTEADFNAAEFGYKKTA